MPIEHSLIEYTIDGKERLIIFTPEKRKQAEASLKRDLFNYATNNITEEEISSCLEIFDTDKTHKERISNLEKDSQGAYFWSILRELETIHEIEEYVNVSRINMIFPDAQEFRDLAKIAIYNKKIDTDPEFEASEKNKRAEKELSFFINKDMLWLFDLDELVIHLNRIIECLNQIRREKNDVSVNNMFLYKENIKIEYIEDVNFDSELFKKALYLVSKDEYFDESIIHHNILFEGNDKGLALILEELANGETIQNSNKLNHYELYLTMESLLMQTVEEILNDKPFILNGIKYDAIDIAGIFINSYIIENSFNLDKIKNQLRKYFIKKEASFLQELSESIKKEDSPNAMLRDIYEEYCSLKDNLNYGKNIDTYKLNRYILPTLKNELELSLKRFSIHD